MANGTVHELPQTAPISDMRNRQNELLDMTENGPVVLFSRSKPAAVLLSPTQWDAIASDLAHNRERALADEPLEQIDTGKAKPKKNGASELDKHQLIKAKVKDGLLIPENAITLQAGHTYLVTVESVQSKQRPEVDALAEIAALAQPIGPSDLARNFDLYSERVLIHEIPE